MNKQRVPCDEAPIGIVTNCAAMGCESIGCAVASAKAAPPVSLDDLRVRLGITPVTRNVFVHVGEVRGVCDDCVWEDHCRLCDCCCEPGTP